jgi:putative AlgH/UPF0301 family transcriptional regulator
MTSPVERAVYRALYRLARKFDRQLEARSFIHRSSSENTDGAHSLLYNNILNSILGKKNLYLPVEENLTFAHTLRRESRNNEYEAKVKVEAGLKLMHKLTSVWRQFINAAQDIVAKGRNFECHDSTGRDILFLERKEVVAGNVLIAHPLLAGPLHRSIILVLENSDKGTYGLVVNRPTSHTLHSAVTNLPNEMIAQFGSANVAFGGMVRRLQYLHTIPNCGGFEIPHCSTPLYAGGMIKKVLSSVKANPSTMPMFQFFVGCCCWRPGQLEQEIESGYWITSETEPDKLISFLKDNSSSVDTKEVAKSTNPVDVYQFAMESLGEKYRLFTNIPHWIDSTKYEGL